MIYCEKAEFGRISRSFALNSGAIRLKRPKNLTQIGFYPRAPSLDAGHQFTLPSLRSVKPDRLLGSRNRDTCEPGVGVSMKKLLILPLLLLLSGCVTYYHPQTAMKDGIYYAEDDPSYVVDSRDMYYPWASLDYFYLAYYPYYYQRYYSRWYLSHYYYPNYPARRPYYGYCPDGGCSQKSRKSRRDKRHDRFAGSDSGSTSSGSRSAKSVARARPSRDVSSRSSNKMRRASSREKRD